MVAARGGFRGAHYQAAVLHSLGADKTIGQTLHVFRFAPQDYYLKTGVVIEMSMQR